MAGRRVGLNGAVLSPRRNAAVLTAPFVLLIIVGIVRLLVGPGHGMLPLLAMGPAVAGALGGTLYTVAVGLVAFGAASLFAVLQPGTTPAAYSVAVVTITGVTIGAAVASHVRDLQGQELTDVRAIADVTQRVLLRPVPDRVGPVRMSARYISASSRARVGGDLYAVVPTEQGLRLIVGDAEGKGLPAVQHAAATMGAFRMAAREESTLSGIVARIESRLRDDLDEEQFVTAVLAEVSSDGREMEILNCGHPQPLLMGPGGPVLLGPADGGLPLGLGPFAGSPRASFTVPWEDGSPVLFYTDGLTEARGKGGEFFPLTSCASVNGNPDPGTLVGRLSAELGRHVTHGPGDDIALLLVWRYQGDAA